MIRPLLASAVIAVAVSFPLVDDLPSGRRLVSAEAACPELFQEGLGEQCYGMFNALGEDEGDCEVAAAAVDTCVDFTSQGWALLVEAEMVACDPMVEAVLAEAVLVGKKCPLGGAVSETAAKVSATLEARRRRSEGSGEGSSKDGTSGGSGSGAQSTGSGAGGRQATNTVPVTTEPTTTLSPTTPGPTASPTIALSNTSIHIDYPGVGNDVSPADQVALCDASMAAVDAKLGDNAAVSCNAVEEEADARRTRRIPTGSVVERVIIRASVADDAIEAAARTLKGRDAVTVVLPSSGETVRSGRVVTASASTEAPLNREAGVGDELPGMGMGGMGMGGMGMGMVETPALNRVGMGDSGDVGGMGMGPKTSKMSAPVGRSDSITVGVSGKGSATAVAALLIGVAAIGMIAKRRSQQQTEYTMVPTYNGRPTSAPLSPLEYMDATVLTSLLTDDEVDRKYLTIDW